MKNHTLTEATRSAHVVPVMVAGALFAATMFMSGCQKTGAPPLPGAEALADNKDSALSKQDAHAKPEAAIAAAKSLPMQAPTFSFGPIRFGYDSSELDAGARVELENAAAYLANHQNVRILVAGHCDDRGTAEYNLALGESRAKMVRKHLGLLGVAPDRIDTVSFGEADPIAKGETEDAYAQNRRAELKARDSAHAHN
jgi:peptidoglycan-associated lipoprotein